MKHRFAPTPSSTSNGVKLCTKDMNAHAILPLIFMPNCDFAPVWPRLGCARHGVDRPAMARPPRTRTRGTRMPPHQAPRVRLPSCVPCAEPRGTRTPPHQASRDALAGGHRSPASIVPRGQELPLPRALTTAGRRARSCAYPRSSPRSWRRASRSTPRLTR